MIWTNGFGSIWDLVIHKKKLLIMLNLPLRKFWRSSIINYNISLNILQPLLEKINIMQDFKVNSKVGISLLETEASEPKITLIYKKIFMNNQQEDNYLHPKQQSLNQFQKSFLEKPPLKNYPMSISLQGGFNTFGHSINQNKFPTQIHSDNASISLD